jgi:hypothetical protein
MRSATLSAPAVVRQLQPQHWRALNHQGRMVVFKSMLTYEPATALRYARFVAGERLDRVAHDPENVTPAEAKAAKRQVSMQASEWLAVAMEPECFADYEQQIVALMRGKRYVARYQIGLQLGLYGRAVAIHSATFVRKGSHYHLA